MRVSPILLLLVPLLATGCASFHHPGDAWLGRDKFEHLGVAALVSAGTFVVLSNQDVENGAASGTAVGVTLSLGGAKEVHDARVKRTYASGKDLVWDAVGAMAGLGLARTLP